MNAGQYSYIPWMTTPEGERMGLVTKLNISPVKVAEHEKDNKQRSQTNVEPEYRHVK